MKTVTRNPARVPNRATPRTGQPPPRWARRAAVVAALTTVPCGLWRTAMALGAPLGVDPAYRQEHYAFPGWGTAYVVGLTALLLGLSSLTIGLVRPWGEVLPRRIPLVGGKPVPRLAAIIPAAAGATALTLLWTFMIANIEAIFIEYGLDGAERYVVLACYLPLLLWGPLLGATTVSYARRTRPTTASRPVAGQTGRRGVSSQRPLPVGPVTRRGAGRPG